MEKIENDQRPGARTGARRFDPAAFLATTAKGRAVSTHQKGKILFAQGDASDAIFYIKKRQGQSDRNVQAGKGGRRRAPECGRILWRRMLDWTAKRLATATAMTECVTMRVEIAEMRRVLRREPEFSQMFVSHILSRSARVEEDLVDQLFNSTEKRLARLLLLLANFGKEGRPEPVIAKISQEMLAEMIGTTRSRVSHFMNKFRQAGFIDYNGHLEVHSSLLTVVLTDPARSVDLPVDDRQPRR
jgi:CRP/FNR family cyclic AMP-dependent transcriptional regulator